MPWAKAERFYAETGWEAAAGGFQVTLDGKPLNTPGDKPLIVPSVELAAVVAGEWAAQDETLDPGAMPLTGLLCTAIDRIGADRGAIAEHIARYGETDLLCYRAADPPALAERQQDAWQPLLDWAAGALGPGSR